MSGNRKYPKEVRVSVSSEVHARLLSMAELRKENMSDLIRPLIEQMVDEKAAEEGIDVVTDSIRKAVTSAMKPIENRLAAMTAKSTIASATTMYTQHHLMVSNGQDANQIRNIHEESRKKAVSYLRTDTSKITETE